MEATVYEMLQQLDGYQKSVVYELYQSDDHTAGLSMHDGAVCWLEQNLMILRVAGQKVAWYPDNTIFLYELQRRIVEELEGDIDLLSEFRKAYERYEIKYKNEQEEKRFSGPYYGYLFGG